MTATLLEELNDAEARFVLALLGVALRKNTMQTYDSSSEHVEREEHRGATKTPVLPQPGAVDARRGEAPGLLGCTSWKAFAVDWS